MVSGHKVSFYMIQYRPNFIGLRLHFLFMALSMNKETFLVIFSIRKRDLDWVLIIFFLLWNFFPDVKLWFMMWNGMKDQGQIFFIVQGKDALEIPVRI